MIPMKGRQSIQNECPVPINVIVRIWWAGLHDIRARNDGHFGQGRQIDQREFRIGLSDVDDSYMRGVVMAYETAE